MRIYPLTSVIWWWLSSGSEHRWGTNQFSERNKIGIYAGEVVSRRGGKDGWSHDGAVRGAIGDTAKDILWSCARMCQLAACGK